MAIEVIDRPEVSNQSIRPEYQKADFFCGQDRPIEKDLALLVAYGKNRILRCGKHRVDTVIQHIVETGEANGLSKKNIGKEIARILARLRDSKPAPIAQFVKESQRINTINYQLPY